MNKIEMLENIYLDLMDVHYKRVSIDLIILANQIKTVVDILRVEKQLYKCPQCINKENA